MESATPGVGSTLVPCRAKPCDDIHRCSAAGKCTYKSSAEESQEIGKIVMAAIAGDGRKKALDGSKTRVELVTPQFIEGIGNVLGFGARKYEVHNWMKGIKFSTIIAGVLRHVFAFARGEEMDAESGLPHLYHAGCGLMFLSWYAHGPTNATYRPLLDDRTFIDKGGIQK